MFGDDGAVMVLVGVMSGKNRMWEILDGTHNETWGKLDGGLQ